MCTKSNRYSPYGSVMCTFGILYFEIIKWVFNVLQCTVTYVCINLCCCTRFKSRYTWVSFHLLAVMAHQVNKKLSEFGSQFLYGFPFSVIIIFVRISDPTVHGRNRAVRQNFWHKTYFLLKLKTHSLSGQKTETLAEGWNSGARRPEAFFCLPGTNTKRSLNRLLVSKIENGSR